MAADGLNASGSGLLWTVDMDANHIRTASENLEGYTNTRIVLGDARDHVPRICKESYVDAVILDVPPFDSKEAQQSLFAAIQTCSQRWWIFTNIQKEGLY